MLYRLRPNAPLEWSDFPGFSLFDEAVAQGADFDRLDWQSTEERVFSEDLLRIALRHGVATGTGIVLSSAHTVDLGRSDAITVHHMASEEAQAELRATQGELLEALIPGWNEQGRELAERVRASMKEAAFEAEEDLAEVIAAPVQPELAAHWQSLGGDVPADGR
jgi:hypothetical protein